MGTSINGPFGARSVGSGVSVSASSNGFGASNGSSRGRTGSTGGGIGGSIGGGLGGGIGGTGGIGNTAFGGGRTGTSALGGIGGQYGAGGTAMFGQNNQFGRQNGRQNMNGGMNQNQSGNTTRPIQINYDLGFDYGTPKTPLVATQMSAQLTRAPGLTALTPIGVQMQGRTAILRGKVATFHDRDLAEQLALLEPGISQIQNELQVGSAQGPMPAAKAPDSGSSAPELPAPANSR
jgi:hypothetical protein